MTDHSAADQAAHDLDDAGWFVTPSASAVPQEFLDLCKASFPPLAPLYEDPDAEDEPAWCPIHEHWCGHNGGCDCRDSGWHAPHARTRRPTTVNHEAGGER